MERILVIEDEENVRSSIRDLLLGVGYGVLEAQNGKEGLDLAKNSCPDLILSDIMMPVMDGYTLLKEAQKNPLTSTIPFIFLTAKVNISDMREAMNLGADDYVTKPFRLGDLLKAIDKRLEKKRKLDEKIKNLTDNISKYIPHELRTPLVSIAGFSDIILNDLEALQPEEILTMAGRIKNGSLRLHETIEKFLTFLETELIAKNPEYRIECFNTTLDNPDDVIRTSAFTVISKTDRRNDLNITPAANVPVYITSPFLDIIITSLVENSVKFSEPGTPIEIRSISEEGFFRIEVEDKGKGMTLDEIARVSPFRQFDRDFVQNSGNGLGLASVNNIVNICGGSMNIESRPGEYTKVSVELRTAEAA